MSRGNERAPQFGGGLRIEDVLRDNGLFVSTISGVSMRPLLRAGKDSVAVKPVEGRLRKYDVALYRSNGMYVLHRVVKMLPEGEGYLIRGDNTYSLEHVHDDQVIGVLVGLFRGEHQVNMDGFGYRCYSRVWTAIFPLRNAKHAVRAVLAHSPLGPIVRRIKRGR